LRIFRDLFFVVFIPAFSRSAGYVAEDAGFQWKMG